VAYGNGVWVAVSSDGTNRAMRSTDNGSTWTAVGVAGGVAANQWFSVGFGDGRFVAVSLDGASQVMFSPASAPGGIGG
jgi:hypothetical protein